MRGLAPSGSGRVPAGPDRKIFSTLLLVSAAACMVMSVLHIEFDVSSVAGFVLRSGTNIVEPLITTIRRHTRL